jgi:type VI secretion system secreted protein VgrG
MLFTQVDRPISVSTPLGDDVLLLRSFEGQEAISRLFFFDLDLLSPNDSINYQDVVGQRVSIRMSLADGNSRYWNGFVSRFTQAGKDSDLAVYHATVVPWVWFLDQTTDCRIFQNKKVPDIIQQIFNENNFKDFSMKLYGNFTEREYCVQYRESDFNFVSRLMEEEGIFYFFDHGEKEHTLVLGNDPSVHQKCPQQPAARYHTSAGGWRESDVILQWSQQREYRPAVYTSTDYNFETPATSLLCTAKADGKSEIYDFPGEYAKRGDGDQQVRIRLQEQQVAQTIARASSDCRAFGVGQRFDLEDHYRKDLNQPYVITALFHSGRQSQDYRSSGSGGNGLEVEYRNSFECVPFSTPIRPPRRTPVPVVQGCQTAVVVGPAGEEIFTDKYGRVKVQFHWDRQGKRDESSSCWVRVSNPWAGKSWGGIHIPRIGQEVIVDFIEGDPDRPIITGRVYNAGQMPPWELPAKAMISGFKSNSTKGGGGDNQFSFDDTKGAELVQLHGQFDMDTKIEHDDRLSVGNNRTKNVLIDESTTIGNNRTEKVGVNENITIGSSRTESVGAHESITVALTRTRNVGLNEMVNVGGAQEVTVIGAQAVTVGGAQAVTVGLIRAKTVGLKEIVNIGAAQNVTIGGHQTTSIGGGQTVGIVGSLGETISGDHAEQVSKSRSATVGQNDTVNVGKVLTIQAGDQIVLQTGKASIVMKKDGTISIQGKDISHQASGKITGNASGDIVLKGSKIQQNS